MKLATVFQVIIAKIGVSGNSLIYQNFTNGQYLPQYEISTRMLH